ncbi:T9SS type A sorting domain-containing protein [Lentimicrobium sp. L6]|uniref:T9SS type A sorting domain-containing protein n=1 Tax=Lentimicrobium sp. L6 TaxID=2735916 RepID=UPI0015532FDD|nr:T9SS type A sorting domain-containing protein [Lentimicrobium sp. L6]NPD84172.1 T9SS type A sorting domain-containing protein [Lentimicrobium sp. L6]
MKTRLQFLVIVCLAILFSSNILAQSFELNHRNNTNLENTDSQVFNYENMFTYPSSKNDFGYADFQNLKNENSTKEAWDVLYQWDATTANQPGVETDGQYIYTAHWNDVNIFKYEMDGTFVESFTIPGVDNGLQDLAYDGQYFYAGDGSDGSMDIFEMDFTNKTLVSTITADAPGITGILHIAYDNQQDAFWCGNWEEITCVNRAGEMISPVVMLITPVNGVEGAAYGSAFDPYSEGGPYLWLNMIAITPVMNGIQLVQYDPIAGEYTGVAHNYTSDLGGLYGYCGGLAIYEDYENNIAVLLGNNQQTPNHIFAYELASLPTEGAPGSPTAASASAAANGVLECTLEWTNPNETITGGALSDLDFVYVFKEGVSDPIHTIENPSIGGMESFIDNEITVSGFYNYSIYGVNDAGDGISTSIGTWVGPDAPAIPENIIATAISNGDEASVTWNAPTIGLHGGYLESISAYRIVRQPDEMVLENSWNGTQPYIDNSLTEIGYHYYEITAINNIGDGETGASNSILLHYADVTYSDQAFAINEGPSDQFEAVDVLNGTFEIVEYLPVSPFKMCGTYINDLLYVVTEQGRVSIFLEDGREIILGEINRPDGWYPSGLAYDEENDIIYMMVLEQNEVAHLFTLDLEALFITEIGAPGGKIMAMDLADDGFLYGPDINDDQLIKIDPSTATSSVVGNIGMDLEYGQDVSYDPTTQRLYTITCGASTEIQKYFGFYDLETGEFNAISEVDDQYGVLAVNDVVIHPVDVAVTSANNPGMMQLGDTYTPLVSVANFGSQTSSFDLTAVISKEGSNLYEETITISNLSYLESNDLIFPQWTSEETGALNVVFTASDPGGDANLENNTMGYDFGVFSGCEHTLILNDSYGDGWTGNTMLVSVNGVTAYPDLTLENGFSASFPVYAEHGDAIFLIFDGEGGFGTECSWELLDGLGETLITGAGPDYLVQDANAICFGVGIEDHSSDNLDAKIYPIPTSDQLIIETQTLGQLQILDMQGRIAFESLIENEKSSFDVSEFVSGIYFVKIITGNQVITKKVIID